MWSLDEKKVICDRFVFHSAKVFDIKWTNDDNYLISGSLDRSCILWDLSKKLKVHVWSNVDNEVINSIAIINDKEFVCGGHSCTVNKISII